MISILCSAHPPLPHFFPPQNKEPVDIFSYSSSDELLSSFFLCSTYHLFHLLDHILYIQYTSLIFSHHFKHQNPLLADPQSWIQNNEIKTFCLLTMKSFQTTINSTSPTNLLRITEQKPTGAQGIDVRLLFPPISIPWGNSAHPHSVWRNLWQSP